MTDEGITRINHIGVLVEDADRVAKALKKTLGLRVRKVEEYGDGELRILFLPVGETDIELIEPLRKDSDNARYLAENGPGIQHIALEVNGLEERIEFVQSAGGKMQNKEPRAGAGNTRIAFIEPESLGGLMIELCEPDGDH